MDGVSAPIAPSIDRLHELIQSPSITASTCISPKLLNYRLQVYLQTRSITDCKFAQSWPTSASPDSLDYGLQVHVSKLAQSWPLSAYLQTRSIMASKCIPTLVRLWPCGLSLSSNECYCQVHHEVLSSTACSQSRYPLDRNFGIPGPSAPGNQVTTRNYSAMQPPLCGGGLSALYTYLLMSWEHFGKN